MLGNEKWKILASFLMVTGLWACGQQISGVAKSGAASVNIAENNISNADSNVLNYEKLKPDIDKYCASCHGGEGAMKEMPLDSLENIKKLKVQSLKRITQSTGEEPMPPKDSKQAKDKKWAEFKPQLVKWLSESKELVGTATEKNKDKAPAGPVTYDSKIKGIVASNCVSGGCHSETADMESKKIQFGSLAKLKGLKQDIIPSVKSGMMPKGRKTWKDEDDGKIFLKWMETSDELK